jgi:hypothetical protein
VLVAVVRQIPVLAGNVGLERQLTGIINRDDRFRAARSVDRLSSLAEGGHLAHLSQFAVAFLRFRVFV